MTSLCPAAPKRASSRAGPVKVRTEQAHQPSLRRRLLRVPVARRRGRRGTAIPAPAPPSGGVRRRLPEPVAHASENSRLRQKRQSATRRRQKDVPLCQPRVQQQRRRRPSAGPRSPTRPNRRPNGPERARPPAPRQKRRASSSQFWASQSRRARHRARSMLRTPRERESPRRQRRPASSPSIQQKPHLGLHTCDVQRRARYYHDGHGLRAARVSFCCSASHAGGRSSCPSGSYVFAYAW
jgi:hypothetical protein